VKSRWVPCQHGTMCTRDTDGGEALQMWADANILNKQSREDTRVALRLGGGAGS
jgi:hypothetical protein